MCSSHQLKSTPSYCKMRRGARRLSRRTANEAGGLSQVCGSLGSKVSHIFKISAWCDIPFAGMLTRPWSPAVLRESAWCLAQRSLLTTLRARAVGACARPRASHTSATLHATDLCTARATPIRPTHGSRRTPHDRARARATLVTIHAPALAPGIRVHIVLP